MSPVQILMTTCPRLSPGNPYSYFHDTSARLLAQLEDGMTITVADDKLRSGHIESFRKALLKTLPGHDVLWLQDDLEFCKNSVKAMLGCLVPSGEGFVSFLDYGHFRVDDRLRWGLIQVPMLSGLRSLGAVKFSSTAIEYLKQALCVKFVRPIGRPDHDDLLVSDTLSTKYSHFSVCVPNLVQHVGRFSSRVEGGRVIDNGGTLRSTTYPGDDFDASTISLS